MSDKRAPKPDEIGGTGSVAAGSPQRPPPSNAWGTKNTAGMKNGAQPRGQAPSEEDAFGGEGVGGPRAGSGA